MKALPHNNSTLQLFVHTPHGDIVSFNDINPEAKINDLKSQLEIKAGILSEVQNLYLSNKKLEDQKSFSDSKIKNGAVLRIKIKERSLQQIYLKAIEGDTDAVFSFGVEFVHGDFTDDNKESDKGSDQLIAWNKFVPLRAFQAMFAACFKGHLELITHLIAQSAADVKMVSKNGRSCLHVAASQGHLNSVSLLLGQGVNSKLTDNEGISALAMAAANGHIKCEKRIWLFTWNNDVLSDLEKQEKVLKEINEKEKERQELNEIAERYQKEFKRVRPEGKHVERSCVGLPPIIPNKESSVKIQKTYSQPISVTLPQLRAPRKEEEKGSFHRKPKNQSTLAVLKRRREERPNKHLRSKSAPQIKEKEPSLINQWNNRVTDWSHQVEGTWKEEARNSPEVASLKLKQSVANDDVIIGNSQLIKINTEGKIPRNPGIVSDQAVLNATQDITTIPELPQQNDTKHWLWRAGKVRPPDENKMVLIAVVDNFDISKEPSKQREIVKTDRTAVDKTKDKISIENFRSNNRSHKERSIWRNQKVKKKNSSTQESKEAHKETKETVSLVLTSNPAIAVLAEEHGSDRDVREVESIIKVIVSSKDEIKEANEVYYCEEELLSEQNEVVLGEDNGIYECKEEIFEDENEGISREENDIDNFELWRPRSSLSVPGNNAYMSKLGQSYEDWLNEKKRLRKLEAEKTVTFVASDNEDDLNKKDEENKQAYEKWLSTKSRLRTESATSLNEPNKEKKLNRSHSEKACTYEQWLESKRKTRPRSTSPNQVLRSMKRVTRVKLKHGMTFEQWIEWKKKTQVKPKENESIEQTKQKETPSNRPFLTWLQAKNEERKLQNALERTKEAQQIMDEAALLGRRMNDPYLKTFEEWSLEKKYNQTHKRRMDKNIENCSKQEKFPEDSNLIFDMWLVEKYWNEMNDEREKLRQVKKQAGKISESLTDSSDSYDSDESSL